MECSCRLLFVFLFHNNLMVNRCTFGPLCRDIHVNSCEKLQLLASFDSPKYPLCIHLHMEYEEFPSSDRFVHGERTSYSHRVWGWVAYGRKLLSLSPCTIFHSKPLSYQLISFSYLFWVYTVYHRPWYPPTFVHYTSFYFFLFHVSQTLICSSFNITDLIPTFIIRYIYKLTGSPFIPSRH